MKKLLTNPNNISAPNNTPDEEEVLFTEIDNFEEKYREKIPWLMALSQQLVASKRKNPEKVIDTREHEFDHLLHEPRLPEKPKPSTMVATGISPRSAAPNKKTVQFQPYKSTRPDLLQKLTSLITKGLMDLQKDYERSTTQDETSASKLVFLQNKFHLFASVFERYIDESTLYRKVLEEIHDSYHDYIDELETQVQLNGNTPELLHNKEKEFQKKLQETEQIQNLKYQVLQEKNSLLEKRIHFLEMDKQKTEAEATKWKDSYHALKKEYDDLRATTITLTAALSRMEEEHRVYQMNESNRMTELTHSKASEQKLNEEIERLQQTLQNMEQIQSSMVNQEVVASLDATIETLRGEVKRVEVTHRQLLLRYAAVKSVIDDAFKKWETQNNSAIAQMKAKDAVMDVLRDAGKSNRKETNKSKLKPVITDPVEQVMQIMEKQGNPKVIIETMLDHIVSNTIIQKNRFGNFEGEGGGGNPFNAGAGSMGLASPNFNPNDGIDGSSPRSVNTGTVAFETDGANVVAEEFKSPWTHFDGLGYNYNIPNYLRFHGKIQNIFLSKRDIIKIIQEIWEAKRAYDQYLSNLQVIAANSAANANRDDLRSLDVFSGNDGGGHHIPINETAGPLVLTNLHPENKPSTAQSVTFSEGLDDNDKNNEERKRVASRQENLRRKLSRTPTYQTSQNLIDTTQQQNQEILNSGIITITLIETLPPNPTMIVFLEAFLVDKLKDRLLAIEMAYNIQDALKRFAALSDCRLFSAILEEKLPLEIWEDQKNMIEKVRDEVHKEIRMLRSSNANNPSESGPNPNQTNNSNDPNNINNHLNKISVDDLMRLLKRLFPTKTDHSFAKLNKAITMDNQNSRYINPKDILYEDQQGNRPHLLEQLKLQYITEAISFEKHVMDCIDQFNEMNEKDMMIGKFRDAISYADPNKSRTDTNKLLSRACAMSIEDMLLAEAKRMTITVEDFKRRLKSGLLQKSAPTAGQKK